jgi:hypothetical protein
MQIKVNWVHGVLWTTGKHRAFVKNVGTYVQVHTALTPRRPTATFSLSWRHQVSYAASVSFTSLQRCQANITWTMLWRHRVVWRQSIWEMKLDMEALHSSKTLITTHKSTNSVTNRKTHSPLQTTHDIWPIKFDRNDLLVLLSWSVMQFIAVLSSQIVMEVQNL